MATYCFRLFNEEGFVYETRHECDDDLDALDNARTFCTSLAVEIWTEGRRVGRVKPNDEPLSVRDRLAL